MCGDSTSVDAVEELLMGQRADMVFTDPPYNVAFNGRSGKFDVIKNDNLPEEQFAEFIKDWLQTFEAFRPNSYYICCNWAFYGILQTALKPKACIVWAKNVFGLGRGYRHQHEFIVFDGLIDPSIKNESDLWNIAKDTKYMHPTQKPTALSERAIKNSTKANNIVLDYFGGSGSTLIACEKQNRHARLMELDPKYCDVIVKRWEDFTGKKAVLLTELTENV
jgi:DNA modification methylase